MNTGRIPMPQGNDGLIAYILTVCDEGVLLLFECMAEDDDHAMDQAMDMYPECKVLFMERNVQIARSHEN